MRRFDFRLASLERLRQHEFEIAQRAWQLLERERLERLATIERLRDELESGRERLADRLLLGSEADRLSLSADAVAVGRLRVDQAVRALREWTPTLQRAVEAMREARKRLRSLERLRERQQARHRAEADRRAQAELDELAQRGRMPLQDARGRASW